VTARILVFLALLPTLAGLTGCAAGWGTHYVYAPFDERRLIDADVTVTRPVVTTRPNGPDTPWGKQADRVGAAVADRFDEPFVSAELVDLADLGWTEESWRTIDQVTDAVLTRTANPLPHEQLRIEEGTPQATVDDLGRDGYVLLVAVQPSMKETLARLTGATGEVVHFAGYVAALNADADSASTDATETPGLPAVPPDEAAAEEAGDPEGEEIEERPKRRDAKKSKRARLVGKQNRVDVAFLLVDRRSGRFVAAHGSRLEPATRPVGAYRGAIERALRAWRIAEEPWTAELLQP